MATRKDSAATGRLHAVEAEDQAAVPPQNLDAEESVLGAIMLSERALAAAAGEVKPDDFYRLSHGLIFRAALELYGRGEPVDAITLTDYLERTKQLEEAGGRVKLHELAALVPATANVGHYARIVRQLARQRQLIVAGMEITQLGWEGGEIDQLLGESSRLLFNVTASSMAAGERSSAQLAEAAFARISLRSQTPGQLLGLPTSLKALDQILSGFKPGELILVAARPSLGKSAFVLSTLREVCLERQQGALLFTLEMSADEISERLLAADAAVDSQALRSGSLQPDDWARLAVAGERLTKAPLTVIDKSALTPAEIQFRVRQLQTAAPETRLVVIDYLQLLQLSSGENRNQALGTVSRSLKQLAREAQVAIVAVAQLNRASESRDSRRPQLSDLRDSGELEQDADIVLLLYRDDYYNPHSAKAGLAEVIVAKHRNGPTGTVVARFDKASGRFDDAQPR